MQTELHRYYQLVQQSSFLHLAHATSKVERCTSILPLLFPKNARFLAPMKADTISKVHKDTEEAISSRILKS